MNRLFAILSLYAYPLLILAQLPDEANSHPVDTVMLKESVIQSSRPISKLDAEGIVTNVEGTALSQLGTARDVLGFMPGVISSNGSVEVLGKGEPVIYINGRRLYSQQELGQLSSSRVKDVTVISNPGAKYSSDINAVIKIATIKEIGDGIALDNRATAGFRNYLYAKDVLWMNYRKGGLDVFSTLEYGYWKMHGKNSVLQDTWDSHAHYQNVMDIGQRQRQYLYDGKIGLNYIASPNHTFGIYYEANHKPIRISQTNEMESSIDDALSNASSTNQHKRQQDTQHLVDGYYIGKWGAFTSNITFDFLWHNDNERQNAEDGDAAFSMRDHNKGRMFAGKIDLSRPFLKGSVNFGGEYTNSRRTSLSSRDYLEIPDNDDKLLENNAGIYIEMQQKLGKLMLMAGLRYEHIASGYYNQGRKIDEQSANYNELLPSVTLGIPIGKSMLQLGYARKYTRPLYAQLSSTIVYSNPSIYQAGNPFLKTTYFNEANINYKWGWLMVIASYRHVSKMVIDEATSYNGSTEITLLTKKNSDRAMHNVQLMAQAQRTFGKHYMCAFTLGLTQQFYTIDYCGHDKHLNNPMGIAKYMNIFTFPKGYMLNANLSWRSEGDSNNAHLGQTWQVDVTASKKFGQHWEVKLAANDIFDTADNNKVTVYSGIRSIEMLRHVTMRSVELNITYRFNVTKSKYKGEGAGSKEKARL